MPYERIVQWAAGPVAILAGLAATAAQKHLHFLGTVGLSRNAVANAIVSVGTFAVGAGVTYAAHHKWLENLTRWWDVVPPPRVLSSGSGTTTNTGGVAPTPPATGTKPTSRADVWSGADSDPPPGVPTLEEIYASEPPFVQSPDAPQLTPEEAANPVRPRKADYEEGDGSND